MSGAITAAVVVGGASVYGANKAADASAGAADTMAQAEQNKLDYLQGTEENPQYYREQGLDQLGGFYGINPVGGSQYNSQQYTDYNSEIADLQSQIDQGYDRGYSDSRGYFTNLNGQIGEARRLQGQLDYTPSSEQQFNNYNSEIAGLESQIAREGSSELSDSRGYFTNLKSQLQGAQDNLASLNYDPNAPAQPTQGVQQDGGYSGQGLINDVQQSPFYGSMISQGEEAIGRNASMTGGLRSGTANENLAQNSQNVLQNLVNQRLQGLTGMANLPSNANAIGGSMSQIGSIQGQGQVASAQAQQQGYQNAFTGIGTAVGQYIGAPQLQTQPPPQQAAPGLRAPGGGATTIPTDFTNWNPQI